MLSRWEFVSAREGGRPPCPQCRSPAPSERTGCSREGTGAGWFARRDSRSYPVCLGVEWIGAKSAVGDTRYGGLLERR